MADRLAHVKAFFFGVALDGFGVRRHVGIDAQPDDVKALHNKIIPALFHAIAADDPGYDPHGENVGYPDATGELVKTAPTEAAGTNGVRWFVELMEAHKAFLQMTGEAWTPLYERLYRPGQFSCFLDDLTAALRKDDPEWRGPLT